MKRKITILICMALTVSAAAVTGYRMYLNSKPLTLVDANIEALSNDEDAVKTKICYPDSMDGDIGFIFTCDKRTNSSAIYPCPDYERNNLYNKLNPDRCVDKKKN